MTHRATIRIGRNLGRDSTIQSYTLAGKLLGTPECYEFLDDIRDRIHDGQPDVRLYMHHVDVVNSSGLGILAAVSDAARQAGGCLTLVGVPQRNRKVMDFMHLNEFIRFEEAEQA